MAIGVPDVPVTSAFGAQTAKKQRLVYVLRKRSECFFSADRVISAGTTVSIAGSSCAVVASRNGARDLRMRGGPTLSVEDDNVRRIVHCGGRVDHCKSACQSPVWAGSFHFIARMLHDGNCEAQEDDKTSNDGKVARALAYKHADLA